MARQGQQGHSVLQARLVHPARWVSLEGVVLQGTQDLLVSQVCPAGLAIEVLQASEVSMASQAEKDILAEMEHRAIEALQVSLELLANPAGQDSMAT
jgi:hypothetical protein